MRHWLQTAPISKAVVPYGGVSGRIMGPRAFVRPCACCGTVHAQDDGETATDSCARCKRAPLCGFCCWQIPYICCICRGNLGERDQEHAAAHLERPRQRDNIGVSGIEIDGRGS